MNFIEDIKDNSLLIIPSNIKEKVLDYINNKNKLINVKIISLNELKKELLFDIDPESIPFLMSKYPYKKEVIEEYISNLYYVEDKSYNIKRLEDLVKIKKELNDKNLIIKHNRLLNYYKDKNIYVYGYDYIDKFNQRLLDNFNNVTYIKKETINNTCNVYEFKDLTDEIYFILEKVCNLIDNDIPVDKIVITNLDDNYKRELYKLFYMSNISINIDETGPIISTVIGKDILNKLKESKDLNATLDYFLEKYNIEDELSNKMYLKILNIFNKYNTYEYDFNIIYECIRSDFASTKISSDNQGIRIESLSNNYFDDDTYVFLPNFNEGSVPTIHKDEDFLSDNIKTMLDLDDTKEINAKEKESLINNIKSIKNLYISYKHNYKGEEYFKSSLVDDITLINSIYDIDYNKIYSNTYASLKLASLIDDLIKFDNKSDYLNVLYNSISIPYREYDNKYKDINKEELKEYLNNEFTLSYSNLNTFNNCKFRFYLGNILKISSGEDRFEAFVGSLFHYILSHINDKDFAVDRLWDEYLKDNRVTTAKEEFYLNKLKEDLYIIVDFVKEFHIESGLTEIKTEEPVKIDKSHDYNITFKGFIDKIMYKEYSGKTLVAIVDYKTGKTECDLRDTYYGLSFQLPVYLYLIDKKNLFDSYKLVGFYLQKILDKEIKEEKGKTYLELFHNNLKLFGYSTDNKIDLSRFDPTYEKSKYIASMSLNKDESFNSNAKILTDTEVENLVKLVDKYIDNAVLDIENAKFDINPKKLSTDKEEITGCKYCGYKDICFRRNENLVYLPKLDNTSFLESGVYE